MEQNQTGIELSGEGERVLQRAFGARGKIHRHQDLLPLASGFGQRSDRRLDCVSRFC